MSMVEYMKSDTYGTGISSVDEIEDNPLDLEYQTSQYANNQHVNE